MMKHALSFATLLLGFTFGFLLAACIELPDLGTIIRTVLVGIALAIVAFRMGAFRHQEDE